MGDSLFHSIWRMHTTHAVRKLGHTSIWFHFFFFLISKELASPHVDPENVFYIFFYHSANSAWFFEKVTLFYLFTFSFPFSFFQDTSLPPHEKDYGRTNILL